MNSTIARFVVMHLVIDHQIGRLFLALSRALLMSDIIIFIIHSIDQLMSALSIRTVTLKAKSSLTIGCTLR